MKKLEKKYNILNYIIYLALNVNESILHRVAIISEEGMLEIYTKCTMTRTGFTYLLKELPEKKLIRFTLIDYRNFGSAIDFFFFLEDYISKKPGRAVIILFPGEKSAFAKGLENWTISLNDSIPKILKVVKMAIDSININLALPQEISFNLGVSKLTARQREALMYFKVGYRTQQICQLMGISYKTVHLHLKKSCEVFGVSKVSHLAVLFNESAIKKRGQA